MTFTKALIISSKGMILIFRRQAFSGGKFIDRGLHQSNIVTSTLNTPKIRSEGSFFRLRVGQTLSKKSIRICE